MLTLRDFVKANPTASRAAWVEAAVADSRSRMVRLADELKDTRPTTAQRIYAMAENEEAARREAARTWKTWTRVSGT